MIGFDYSKSKKTWKIRYQFLVSIHTPTSHFDSESRYESTTFPQWQVKSYRHLILPCKEISSGQVSKITIYVHLDLFISFKTRSIQFLKESGVGGLKRETRLVMHHTQAIAPHCQGKPGIERWDSDGWLCWKVQAVAMRVWHPWTNQSPLE